MAAGKPEGSVEANMKMTKSGGSSSDFSERVPGVLGDLVRLVEDVDLAA